MKKASDGVGERVARIEEGQERIEAMLVEALKDIRPRVSSLERWRWVQTGAGAVIAAFLTSKLNLPLAFK